MKYQPRVVDLELDELLGSVAAIALEGAKGVGKTATALRRAATVHRLDDPEERALAQADLRRLATGATPILVDEWQRLPPVWDVVRRAVDDDRSPGQFLLTGSAMPGGAPTHSGAGRIVTVRMRPMALSERGLAAPTVSLRRLLDGARSPIGGSSHLRLEDYAREIVASGFPGVRDLGDRARRAQLDGYLLRIAEHEFPDLGRRLRNPAALRRWMTAYAAATSTTATFETIREAATGGSGEKPARTTVQPYLDTLERLWIVEPVPAWLPTRSSVARLAAPPKHQLADPALAARLLGVGIDGLLGGHVITPPIPRAEPLLGTLFESLVTLSVRVYAQAAEASVMHLRTKGGEREVDLIVELDDRRVLAVEVKLGRTVNDNDVRHLAWLRDQLGDDLLDAVVVTTGETAYRRPDGVAVVPAALLGP
jgi:predicted AAA+ superfamily ATPase